MSNSKDNEKIPIITVEELLGSGREPLERYLQFESRTGEIVQRRVKFRRLTFKEIEALADIPKKDEGSYERYTRTVIKLGSIEPSFGDVDILVDMPSGFINNYAALILDETGKTPFLSQGSLD